jgi:hypothetical protein
MGIGVSVGTRVGVAVLVIVGVISRVGEAVMIGDGVAQEAVRTNTNARSVILFIVVLTWIKSILQWLLYFRLHKNEKTQIGSRNMDF